MQIAFLDKNINLDALIYQSKATLEKLSNEIVKSKLYGYSCDKKAEPKMNLLQNYLRILEDENRKVALGGNHCLNNYKLQSLVEKVRKITTDCNMDKRKDLIHDTDEMLKNSWVTQNPYCVSRERWEKLSYTICDAFNLTITMSVQDICDFTFEIVRKLIPCDIIIAISVYQDMCDLGFKIIRTEEECEIDFQLLQEEIVCDLDLKTYQKLIDCNLSFDMIKTVYENGCSFEIGGPIEVDTLSLVTPLNKYPIDKLQLKGNPNIEILNKLGVDISSSNFVKNPRKFVQKLKQDYGE